MSVYGDDHDGHVCERCDREYLLRDDAEPTLWCDECAQAIAADITERLAAVEAEREAYREAGTNLLHVWDNRLGDEWTVCRENIDIEADRILEANKAGGEA